MFIIDTGQFRSSIHVSSPQQDHWAIASVTDRLSPDSLLDEQTKHLAFPGYYEPTSCHLQLEIVLIEKDIQENLVVILMWPQWNVCIKIKLYFCIPTKRHLENEIKRKTVYS